MLISTKGRYALRVMIDLAQNKESGHVAMKIVASRQGISLKYFSAVNQKNIRSEKSFVLRRETLLRSHAWNAMHLSVKEKISVTQLECGLIFTK